MNTKLLLATGVAAAVSIAGCGRYAENENEPEAQPQPDSSSVTETATATTGAEPLSCDRRSTPCGGNVAGTWNVVDCPLELMGDVDVSGFGLGCIGGTTHSGSLQISGTWVADGVGNVDDDTVTEGSHEFELPASCLEVPEVYDCSMLDTPFRNGFGYATIECVDNPDTGGCLCSGTFDQQGGLGTLSTYPLLTGRYTVAGSTLTTVDRGVKTNFDYCVTDDAMVLTPLTPSKVGVATGSIVLQRK